MSLDPTVQALVEAAAASAPFIAYLDGLIADCVWMLSEEWFDLTYGPWLLAQVGVPDAE